MKSNKNVRKFIYFIAFITFLACKDEPQHPTISRGFYHWKTKFSLSKSEKEILDTLHIQKLYIHFFDVDYDFTQKQATPKALVQLGAMPTQEIVPTVFITNRTIQQLSQAQILDLAKNILLKINELCKEKAIHYQEIQLDCDWSKTTKSKYFLLLHTLKKQLPSKCKLSATIRLHQIKFADITGVPPADRGLLMCYNVDDWRSEQTQNSIFDARVVEQYLHNFESYDLPLDIAMPIFSQTIVYRNHQFLTFLNNKKENELTSSYFLEKTSKEHTFIAKKDTSAWGFAFRKGDIFRAESPDFDAQKIISEQLIKKIKNDSLTFLLYHLDTPIIDSYTYEKLKSVFPKDN